MGVRKMIIDNELANYENAKVQRIKNYLDGIHKVLMRQDFKFGGKTLTTAKIILQSISSIVDYHASFICGKPVTLTGDKEKLALIQSIYKKGFYNRTDYNIAKDLVKYGNAYEYVYKDEKGIIKSEVLNASDAFPLYEDGEYVGFVEYYIDPYTGVETEALCVTADAVPQITAVYDMIASDQPCEIECLAGRIGCDYMLFCPVIYHLCRDMTVPGKCEVSPYLITDHIAVVRLVDFHRLFQFPAFPDPSGRIVGRTENRKMDMVFLKLLIHIFIVHPPDPAAVFFQRAVHGCTSQALDVFSESQIKRTMDENLIARLRKHLDGARHKAMNTILITDMLLFQATHAEMIFLPFDDGSIIFLRWPEIPERRMLYSLCDRFCY